MTKKARWTKKDLEALQKREALLKPQVVKASLFDQPPDNIYNILLQLKAKEKAVYIPWNVPSLKNSEQIIRKNTSISSCCKGVSLKSDTASTGFICGLCKKTTTRFTFSGLVANKNAKKYQDRTASIYIGKKDIFHKMTEGIDVIALGIYYIRETRHRFDYHNMVHIIADQMAKYGWINDDDSTRIKILPLGFHLEPAHAGCIITVIPGLDNIITDLLKNSLSHE